jgi:serine/threonine protein kinase
MGAVSADQRAPHGPLPAGARLGRYEVLAKLAAGGMAIVYVARAQGVAGFERLVAIKVLHSNLAHEEEFIKMFLDEARLAASIRHPNVVPTIDISDSEKSGYFIVMEYIEGDHLGQLLSSANKANEKLPIPVTLRMIADALGGLGAAHDLCDENGKPQNLVHRDVSPHNIMVGRDGVARLTDFGVAKAEDRLTITRDGQVKGKLAYMAPEQAASGMTDTRSDLFSMGVILWECLTGQRLMRAESTAATLHKLLHSEIPTVSGIDPRLAPLDAVLHKALAREPELRFQTAEEFAQALEDVSAGLGGMASLREVGRIVKQHAAIKLKRDKKLIEEALKALRPAEPPSADEAFGADETSSPSSSEISIVAGAAPSIISKVSGVFANDTMPGTRRAGRRTLEVAVPRLPPQPAAPSGERPPLAAPPPAGMNSLAPSPLAEPSIAIEIEDGSVGLGRGMGFGRGVEVEDAGYEVMSGPDKPKHKVRWASLLVAAAAMACVAVWANISTDEQVRVEEMSSPTATPTLTTGTTEGRSLQNNLPPTAASGSVRPALAGSGTASGVQGAHAAPPSSALGEGEGEGTGPGSARGRGDAQEARRSDAASASAVSSNAQRAGTVQTASPAAPRTRDVGSAARAARSSARRAREASVTPRAPEPQRLPDVMPNPYHTQ